MIPLRNFMPLFVVLILSLVACSGSIPAVEGENPARGGRSLDGFSDRLAREDHRFLDTLEVSGSLLEKLQRQGPSLPYSLGRALEERGRVAAAGRSYQFSSAAGIAPWAGLSATRQARIFSRRQDWSAAYAWAVRGTEVLPQYRDAWFYRGEALYRMEEYDRLLTLEEELPPDHILTAGENVTPGQLKEEMAVWGAVARFERDPADTAGFVRAFVEHPAGDIHSRLYLYLYYRSGALERFSPAERLLLEGVYRVSRNEWAEAIRLLTMLEPVVFLGFLETAQVGGGNAALPGLYSTVDTTLSAGNSRSSSWLARIAELSSDGRVTLLQARAASVADDQSLARTLLQGLFPVHVGDTEGADPEVRRRAREGYLESSINAGTFLPEVLRELEGSDASAEEIERVIDRLLPVLVRERRFEVVEESLKLLPEGAPGTQHLQLILTAADAAGLYDFGASGGLPLQDGPEWSPLNYFGLAFRVVTGSRSDIGKVLIEESAAGARHLDHRQLNFETASGFALLHGDALITAGLSNPALSLSMEAALDPDVSDSAMVLARRYSDLGYHSAALDLARRAQARGNLSLSLNDLLILYPPAYREEIEAAAVRYDVPPAMLTGLVREESHFRRDAESDVGARGLTQLMPATAEDILRRLRLDGTDLDNPEENLRLGAFYLDYLGEQLDVPVLRVAAYNAGLGRGRRWSEEFGDLPAVLQIESLPFVETRWYLRRIAVSSAVYQWLRDNSAPEVTFQRLFFAPGEQ